jgi:hypothetical protein
MDFTLLLLIIASCFIATYVILHFFKWGYDIEKRKELEKRNEPLTPKRDESNLRV